MRATKTGWREKLQLWEEPFPHGSFFLFPAPETYAGVFYDRGAFEYFYQSRFFIRGQVFGFYLEALAERFNERINRIVDG